MKKLIEETPIGKLMHWSIGLGLGIFVVGGSIGNVIFDDNSPEIFTACLVIMMFAVSSLVGFASIKRREAPGGTRGIIKGTYAVVTGLVWVAFCSAGIIGGLYVVISEIWK